jgi:hypothetical protein
MENYKTFGEWLSEAAKEYLTEFEVYVDNDGYAHDDEGNATYVGHKYAGQIMSGSEFTAASRNKTLRKAWDINYEKRKPSDWKDSDFVNYAVKHYKGNKNHPDFKDDMQKVSDYISNTKNHFQKLAWIKKQNWFSAN